MSNTKKIILGILTFLPIIIISIYILIFFRMFFDTIMLMESNPDPSIFIENFFMLFVFMGIAGLLNLGVFVYYLIDVIKNKRFQGKDETKLVWILILIFTGLIGMVIYFFVEIYPRKAKKEIESLKI